MKKTFSIVFALIGFQSVLAQNAILYEGKNIIVKSTYSSLVAGEQTSIFYELTNQDFKEVVPVVAKNGKLIDSLQSPISIVANKGPYVCLAFVFKQDKKPNTAELVWIPVTSNHNTKFRITNFGSFFEKEDEVNSNGILRVAPLIGTNTSHCKSVNLDEIKASLVSGGQIKLTVTSYRRDVDMSRIRYMASEGDMISIQIMRASCVRSNDTVMPVDLPLADTYVKGKFTSVKTLWNYIDK